MSPSDETLSSIGQPNVNRRRFLGLAAGSVGAATVGAMVLPTGAQAATAPVAEALAPAGDPDDGFSLLPPNEVSFVPITKAAVLKAVAQLDAFTKNLVKETGIPGLAVGVVYKGEILFSKGYGVRQKLADPKKELPVNAQTVFQIASLSKAVASTVVAGVVGKNGLSWHDPIVKYLPKFSLGDPYVTKHVTLADLFSHRSGLPDHPGDLLEDLGYTQAQIIAKLQLYPMQAFRANYEYTNFGLTVAALAAAASQGLSWEALSQKVLYGPLGMKSTSGTYAQLLKQSNRAALHVQVGNKWVAKYHRDADKQSPAGGVNSSLEDMTKWLRLQLAGGKINYNGKPIIANEQALKESRLPHFVSQPAQSFTGRSGGYAFGYNVGNDAAARLRLSHSGAFGLGAATAFDMLPSEELGIVSLSNGNPIGLVEAINSTFYDWVEHGTSTRDWFAAFNGLVLDGAANPSILAGKKPPAHPVPAKSNAAYVGTYTNPIYDRATVTVSSKGLVLSLGPTPQRFLLHHWDGNLFAYYPTGETAAGISAVTFTLGSNGRASSVNVELLNGIPQISPTLGTFKRLVS